MDDSGCSAEFLASTDVVDWHHPDVQRVAWMLASGLRDPVEVARRCFEWVRDEIEHSIDFDRREVTCSASEALGARTGFCYAKSHLLAALLRASGIPAGFCYQRLSINGDGPPFSLHGLNAVFLPDYGWYRVDARGNRAGSASTRIDAQFTPPVERLAFTLVCAGEKDLPGIYAEPLDVVVATLTRYDSVRSVYANLPDLLAAGDEFPSCIAANAEPGGAVLALGADDRLAARAGESSRVRTHGLWADAREIPG